MPPLHYGAANWTDSTRSLFEHLLDDIRSFNPRWVVPFDTAISPQIIKNRAVWVMLFFGFFPLTALNLGLVQDGGQLVFALISYYCLAWAGYFYFFVSKRSASLEVGMGALVFTAFIGIPLLLKAQSIPGISHLYGFTRGGDLVSSMIGFIFGVGILEEVTKAVPVLILAYKLNKVEKPLDGIFYGAMSGLGFAVAEGVQYISNSPSSTELVVQTLIRTTTLPFMHALWAATAGYFIALSLINRRRSLALIVLGIGVAALHHGLYDTFAGRSPAVALALAAFLYLLFVAYLERSQNMVAELQHAEQVAHAQTLQWQAQAYAAQTGAPQQAYAGQAYPGAPSQAYPSAPQGYPPQGPWPPSQQYPPQYDPPPGTP